MNNFYQKNITFFDKIFYHTKQKSLRRNFLSVTFSIVFALFLSFVIISALGTKPEAFFAMFSKVFSWDYNSQEFIVQICTYVIAALAFSFSMKVGIFNIGISGQMMAGASMSYLIISTFQNQWAPAGGQIITMLLSIVGATAVALTIGLLKIYFKVNEVVSAILLNWIILYIVGALIYKFNLDESAYGNLGLFQSNPLHVNYSFWQEGEFWGWEWSIAVTVIAVIAIWAILKFTTFGHKLKTTGQSPFAAQNFGYNKNALQLWSFAISGILSGILATIVFTAQESRALDFQNVGGTALNTVPIQGFNGIAIGLISLNNPFAIVLVSFIFSFPSVGAAPAGLPASTVQLVLGIMMYIVAIYTLLNYFKPWRYFIKNKYGKSNAQNYMNLENSIFEIAEKFNFEKKRIKNEIIESKINQQLANVNNKFLSGFIKNIFLKPVWLIVVPLSNSEYKSKIQENKQLYSQERIKIERNFRVDCVFTLIDHWKHEVNFESKSFSKIQTSWFKDKEKLNKWITEIKNSDYEIDAVNFDEQFKMIDEKINSANYMGGN